MADYLPPDDTAVPDEPPGLWDSLPPEPPDHDDLEPPDPPDVSWLPDEYFDDPYTEPTASDPEPANEMATLPLFEQRALEPWEQVLPGGQQASQDTVQVIGDDPASIWDKYLASITPDKNPDVLEGEQVSRAEALSLVDARFIGFEHQDSRGEPTTYSVGCIEVYGDPASEGALEGKYLEIASFNEPLEAMALYDTLQTPVEKGWIPAYSVHELANFAVQEQGTPEVWREAQPEDMAVYYWYAGNELGLEVALDKDFTHNSEGESPSESPETTFNALSMIGIEAVDFNPDQEPPPFYDPETGTAYWVGIFQPDLQDPTNCVASILSLGRNSETGALEAQIASCVPGDWDKAFDSSQHLLSVMQQEGIDACFLAAESMAIATDQRDSWETERGMALDKDYAEQAAEYAHEAWNIDL